VNADVNRKKGCGRWIAALVLCSPLTGAGAFDIFRTDLAVPPEPSGAMLHSENPENQKGICVFGTLGQPLNLTEAIERSLCNNPKTREAWATVKVQSAGVGIAKAAFLPTVSASWQATRDNTMTNIRGFPGLSSRQRATERAYSVSLSWVLYDFGGRSAALANATELLAAAQATHEATLQDTFMNTAKDYYAAQAAYGNLVATDDIEQASQESFKAASSRVDKGIAPISDQLQAQTVYAQAVYSRTKAQGDWQIALGTLMADLDLDPDQGISLPTVENVVATPTEFTQSLDDLIIDAKETHPSVRAARAQFNAALAKLQQTQSEGLPNVSLIGKYSWNNQPVSPSLGEAGIPARASDKYIGVQITMPLFEGFGRTYQMKQTQAQAEVARVKLEEAQRKVVLDVWSSEHALRTATENIGNSATLLDIAQRSYAASFHRYLAGVGNILELLNTQTALATARKQRVQALTDWRTARLQLAATLGKLGMWSLALP
jgi:outer membrane protein